MGILSDTLEDNRERAGQLLGSVRFTETDDFVPWSMPSVVPCPICPVFATSEDDLQRHILAAHRRLQVYVRVNGEVIQELHYTAREIDEFVVVVLGDSPADVSLSIADETSSRWHVRPGKTADIGRCLSPNFTGIAVVTVSLGQTASRQYKVFCRTQPVIEVAALDAAAMELQAEMLSQTEPQWAEFQNRHVAFMQKTVEARYLEGLFAYILGCNYEQKGSKGAGKLFEDAFGRLRPFNSTLAHTARCVLALKLNAFSVLHECGPASQFYNTRLFFNGGPDDRQRPPRFSRSQGNSCGIWVDTFSEGVLEAVDAYYARNWRGMSDCLKRLSEHPFVGERNNGDKLLLLQARLCRSNGDIRGACALYRELHDHPLFAQEAQSYCANK